MARGKPTSEDRVLAELVRRIYWREGPPEQRLRKAEQRAKQRAKNPGDWIDVDLERAVAKLARRTRKALKVAA